MIYSSFSLLDQLKTCLKLGSLIHNGSKLIDNILQNQEFCLIFLVHTCSRNLVNLSIKHCDDRSYEILVNIEIYLVGCWIRYVYWNTGLKLIQHAGITARIAPSAAQMTQHHAHTRP